MFDVGESLRDAFSQRESRLRDAQASVARANSGEEAGALGRRGDGADRAGGNLYRSAARRRASQARGDQGGDKVKIDLLDAAASGMDAQRAALDVAARNVAAAEAAGPNGDYARMIPVFRIVDCRRW